MKADAKRSPPGAASPYADLLGKMLFTVLAPLVVGKLLLEYYKAAADYAAKHKVGLSECTAPFFRTGSAPFGWDAMGVP